MYNLATIKHIAEILVCSDYRLYVSLSRVTSKEIENTVAENIDAPSDPLTTMIKYIEIIGWEHSQINKFKRDFTRFSSRFKENELPYEYLVVPEADKALRNKIGNELRKKFPSSKIKISDSDWTQISRSFSEFVKLKSCNFIYEPETNGIIEFLSHTSEYYTKEFPNDILRALTSIGMNQEIEGSDFGASDYLTEELNLTKDYERFDLLSSNIYNVTSFLYRHNNEIYYDIFSRYKFKKVNEYKERIQKLLLRSFKFSNLFSSIKVEDANFKVTRGRSQTSEEYARVKLKDRDDLLTALDPIIEGNQSISDLPFIVKKLITINDTIIDRSRGKDKRPVFDSAVYSSKDKLDTDTKIEYLVRASFELKKFIEYLRESQISVFSVPSDIFKDEKLVRRFSTFNKYMEYLDTVKQLIEEEEDNFNFPSNDAIYSDLMNSSENVINNIPLRTLKDVIDSRDEGRDKGESRILDLLLLERAYRLYSKFRIEGPLNNLASIFYRELNNYENIKRYLLKTGHLKINTSGKWTVDEKTPDLEVLVSNLFKEDKLKIASVMVMANYDKFPDVKKYLSYFRTVEFIKVFINLMGDLLEVLYIDYKGNRVYINSNFKLFLEISTNKDIFSIPEHILNYTGISNILDKYSFDYYIEEGKDLQSVNEHLVSLYKVMCRNFDEFLTYIRNLKERAFESYKDISDVVDDVDGISRDELKKISVGLYYTYKGTGDLRNSNFMSFLIGKKIDKETGIVMQFNRFYRKIDKGVVSYLHETGNWIKVSRGDISVTRVTEEDTFY